MQELDDTALLRKYVERNSEEAFAALVTRHVNKVYSVALRHTGNPHSAEEITQAVFVILAKKSRHLGKRVILSGWLYQTARLAAVTFIRGGIRRARREQEAYMQTVLNEPEPEVWRQIAPLLDAAMAGLNETDRHAVVLRFFDGKSLREVGAALGANEEAAKKRVSRALEKLRTFFARRGVSSTTAIIAGAISANSVQAAPVALAKTVTAVALAKGAAASGSTLTLIKGALKIMAWTKAKTAIVGSAVVLLAAGTTTITVKEIQEHRTYPWQVHEGLITFDQLNQPPQVRILHSTFHKSNEYGDGNKLLGTGVRAQDVIASAYGFVTPARAILPAGLPADRYDYIACLRGGRALNEKALQEAVKRKFGVIAKTETRDTDVWLLKVKHSNAPALKRHTGPNNGNGVSHIPGGFRFWNDGMDFLVASFEFRGNRPVIDGTGLSDKFDFDLICSEADLVNRDLDAVNQALAPLGLELVPTNMPIEILVVEKAK
jgi:uncharacterized protein (TIGR03435 family)